MSAHGREKEGAGLVYHVYCDESRQTNERFMVLGGILVTGQGVEGIEKQIMQCRDDTKMHAELKWGKVGDAKLEEYRAFVDLFFALNKSDHAHFHSMCIDTWKLNHKLYNEGDRETGFYKFYYQLLLHSFGGKYLRGSDDTKLLLYLDRRNTSYKLSKLKEVLNRGIEKTYKVKNQPFVTVEARDSKSSNLLQLADILMGAVGFQKNGYHRQPGAKKSKVSLAEHIAAKVGVDSLANFPQQSGRRFTVWNFRLKPRLKKKEDAPQP